jgi:hypothetical protein
VSKRPARPHKSNQLQQDDFPVSTTHRCHCGRCSACTTDDRWEKIFQANHGSAEREYYAPRPMIWGGSFTALDEASLFALGGQQPNDTAIELHAGDGPQGS